MNLKRQRRLYYLLFLLLCLSLAVGFVLYALRQNINLYFTPQQLKQWHRPLTHEYRLGGVVVVGSVHHVPHSLHVSFAITDFHDTIPVYYSGVLPSLFRPGQGVVVQGKLNSNGVFIADQVLAKHDNNYHPPAGT